MLLTSKTEKQPSPEGIIWVFCGKIAIPLKCLSKPSLVS